MGRDVEQPRPFLMLLFTGVRGRIILGTSALRSSRKFALPRSGTLGSPRGHRSFPSKRKPLFALLRVLMRSFDEDLLENVRAYRETEPYEKAVRKRKVWVEPIFAEAKEWHGMKRFRLRTLRRVNAEAMGIAAGQNIKRLLTFSAGRGPRKLAQS
jgi:hypothetical protein